VNASNIYLTFDDGPDARWTPRILDVLAAAGVAATFFVIGRDARREPALLRRIAGAGHEIGNHTWSHRYPLFLSTRSARQEVTSGMLALGDILGELPAVFRPPHGCVRECMVEEAAVWGENLALWTVSAIDWGIKGTAHGIAERLNLVKPNDIVLMHDGKRGINRTPDLLQVLPAFLRKLRERNLHPATLTRQTTAAISH
jgi:peptidoglycan-N-acetylglucosamine deacetylase